MWLGFQIGLGIMLAFAVVYAVAAVGILIATGVQARRLARWNAEHRARQARHVERERATGTPGSHVSHETVRNSLFSIR